MLLLRYQEKLIEVGIDEAGRGALSGPVVAAAVILPDGFKNDLLNDSKKLSEKNRESLREVILNSAVAYGIGVVSPQEIDKINILQATYRAMHLAVNQLKSKGEFLLIDGNRFKPYKELPFECIVKGDGKYMNIAAASILAKTERDHIMVNASEEFPMYAWEKNKGYGTKKHVDAMRAFGLSKHHRKTFQLKSQLKLEL